MKSETRTTRVAGGHGPGKPGAKRDPGNQSPARAADRLQARAVSPEERRRMIAEAAYLTAERRRFQGGSPERDWLEAEIEVDAMLLRRGTSVKL